DVAHAVERPSVLGPRGEAIVARLFDPAGDLVQRPVERPSLPVGGAGGAVEDMGNPERIDGQLVDVGALGAERALADRAARVALDVDDPSALGVDVQATTHRTVRADTFGQRPA